MKDDTQELLFSPLSVGDSVPESFSFKMFHDGEIRDGTLGSFRGKWLILFFYPGDFTFVCPTELGELAEQYGEFRDEGIEIVSMSTDTVYSHKVWHETSDIVRRVPFPMGSDHRHELVDAFNIYCEDDGLSYRATVIIDPGGIIRCVEVHDNSIGRSVQELLRKVRAAKYVHEHPEEVCPASWKAGDRTLEPGVNLIGKL